MMEKTKFNDEIEKLFAECINWAITGPESWHFRATNLMSEMNQEAQRLAAENEKHLLDLAHLKQRLGWRTEEVAEYKKLANEAITNEEMETHAADQMSMQVDTLLTKVNRMYEANVKLLEEQEQLKFCLSRTENALDSVKKDLDSKTSQRDEAIATAQTLSAELAELKAENLKTLEALEGALGYIEELKSNNWNNLTEVQKDEAIRKA